MKIETGSDFIITFQDMSTRYVKIFVPDRFDEQIADNLIRFVRGREESLDLISLAMQRYMKLSQGYVTSVRDFANKFPEYYLAAKDGVEQEQRIIKLMNSTEKRMKDTERDDLN